MTHTDLKPCPWCQKADRVRTFELSGASFGVVCHQCGVQFDCRAPTPEEAITAWNTRAHIPDTAPSQSADLIYESELWCEGRPTRKSSREMVMSLITALRAAEAENARLREALTGIQKSAEGYNNGVLQVVAETARRTLGGGNE